MEGLKSPLRLSTLLFCLACETGGAEMLLAIGELLVAPYTLFRLLDMELRVSTPGMPWLVLFGRVEDRAGVLLYLVVV